MSCHACGHDVRSPVTKVCLWCFDRNLLAGGYSVPRYVERWTAEERVELEAQAERLRHHRELNMAERRAARAAEKSRPPAQGALS